MKLKNTISGLFASKSDYKFTYKKIKTEVDKIANLISVPIDSLPTYRYSRDMAYPHIEIDKMGKLHYVIIERGKENERRTTENLDELLYWIFQNITFSMASQYELNNRIELQDCRRLLFSKQLDLLKLINPDWARKRENDISLVLKTNPFDDLASSRATYCGQLRKQGLSDSEIDKLAYEKYPVYK